MNASRTDVAVPIDVPAISLEHIDFFRDDRPILRAIHWQVRDGEAAAIIGANGCGKSTLLRLIAGYLWPTRGTVTVLGHRLGEYPVAELRQRIGIVESLSVYPFDPGMTALEVVCSGFFGVLTMGFVTPTDEQWNRSAAMLRQVGLPGQSAQTYATLSTGQRMRCLLARALVRRPQLLLLDEPTAGLDLPARETTLAALAHIAAQPHAPATVMVTHHLEELLPGTNNILLLNLDGTTRARGPATAVLTDEHLSTAYRWPVTVVARDKRHFLHSQPQAWPDPPDAI